MNKREIYCQENRRLCRRSEIQGSETFWSQVNTQAGGLAGREAPFILVISIDITDVTQLRRMQKKRTEQTEALKDALAVAERANHAKTDFYPE